MAWCFVCFFTFKYQVILAVNVYIPPCFLSHCYANCWPNLENYINEFEVKYPRAQVILLGDFKWSHYEW